MLTLFLLLQLAGALLAIALPAHREAEAKVIALGFTALNFAIAVVMYAVFDRGGYSTKLTYMPPAHFLGGALGGLQLGVSYSPTLGH